jgi:hypothetical protein
MKKPLKQAKAVKPAKTPKKTVAKKTPDEQANPLMVHTSSASTKSRRNVSSGLERSDRFINIEKGIVPFNYSQVGYGSKTSDMDVKDAVMLCQKAYYNFGVFRHTIDLMTEFSCTNIFLREGSLKSRGFFEALFNKINLWDLQDKFFREYYRSGNVFLYRFDATVAPSDIKKITQTFGQKGSKVPARYTVLNPADIQKAGNITFSSGVYYKTLTGYELERLRNPRTKEDEEVLNHLDSETKELIKNKSQTHVKFPLDNNRLSAIFYKRQDYEPLAVPMGYTVLDDLNWKSELKKMDMAVARTMQQAILLVTMGAEPDKGGINQKNLEAMQALFQNESVGRVLIADYTTKADFVLPKVGDLLDPKKYEVVDQDIALGLNNMLFGGGGMGGERYANQNLKIQVFLGRLRQARQAFLNEFLQPEIKRVAKDLGFKNYPTAYFDEITLNSDVNLQRIYARLVEVGVLTPEEGLVALDTGRLPNSEESQESQQEFKKLKDKGLYEPLLGGPETQKQLVDKTHEGQMELQNENLKSQEKMNKEKMKSDEKKQAQQNSKPGGSAPQKSGAKPQGQSGRPGGSSSPQTTKKVTPVGQGKAFLISKVSDSFLKIQKLQNKVEAQLMKEHKLKKLSEHQEGIAGEITKAIVANEDPKDWGVRKIRQYLKDPTDKNPERVKEILEIAYEHQVDEYLASVLYLSKANDEK